jgi:signal peptidase I
MAPSIVCGDRVIADKTAYDNTEPKRGDIVLFKNPQNRKQRFVQRIIALGGDTVEGKNGQLLINGRPLVHEWVKTITIAMPRIDIPRGKQQNVKGDVFYEINNEVRYQVLIEKASPETANNTADFGPVAVPPYHCFLMGDNRSRAYDSRWFGPISLGAIQGKFRYLYWPRKDWSRFGKVE